MAERLDLAVIESRWWDASNDSVRGLFDMLAGILMDNPFAYHYEMFSNADALEEVILRISAEKDIHNLYIAAHGDRKYLRGAGKKNKISRTKLRNTLGKIGPRRLYGLFIGSCEFGINLSKIAERTRLTWIAGYTREIPWVHSSLMDIYFWNAYYQSDVPAATDRKQRAALMLWMLGCLYERVPSMFSELGFRVLLDLDKEYVPVSQDFFESDEGKKHLKDVREWIRQQGRSGNVGAWREDE